MEKSNEDQTMNNIQSEVNSGSSSMYNDEINLAEYFVILWKHKSFVLNFSLLPTFIVAAILYIIPQTYKVTYSYSDWNFTNKDYQIFIDRFYSNENLDKLTHDLGKKNMTDYAEAIKLANKKSRQEVQNFIDFEVWPLFADLSNANVDLSEAEKMIRLKEAPAQLIKMTIFFKSEQDMPVITSTIRDNVEKVIPIYSIKENLVSVIRNYKNEIIDIEENRFSQDIKLKADKAVLAKLKNIGTEKTDQITGDVFLQFDVSDKSEYLPLEYQIHATEAKIVSLEEQIKTDQEMYNYYTDLLSINEKILAEIETNFSVDYTTQKFQLFLVNLLEDTKTQEFEDYLNSFINKTENMLEKYTPVIQQLSVYSVARGTAKKSAIVFLIALIISTTSAFLLESFKNSRACQTR